MYHDFILLKRLSNFADEGNLRPKVSKSNANKNLGTGKSQDLKKLEEKADSEVRYEVSMLVIASIFSFCLNVWQKM